MHKKINNTILRFCRSINNEPNHRYRSWEHCYQFFRNWRDHKAMEIDFDLPTLHLAFYLASWGMYRGSSMLLWKDYRIHVPVVTTLKREQYDILWNVDGLIRSQKNFENELFELVKELREIYSMHSITPTDTLITKVLLGTLGCVPAYDRLFKLGIKRWNKHEAVNKFPVRFGINSIRGIVSFCQEHYKELLDTQAEVKRMRNCHYPIMKLVDMFFWELGRE